MIETLESRNLFSAVVHAAAAAYLNDVAAIDKPLPVIQGQYVATMRNVRNELKIYGSSSSATLVAAVDTAFDADYAVVRDDLRVGKYLYGRDFQRLNADLIQEKHHSLNPAYAAKVVFDENLLMSQATAAASTLSADAADLQDDTGNALDAIVTAHPIDATLVAQDDHLAGALSSALNTITGDSDQIQSIDVPNYIAAVDPGSSVLNAA